MSKDSTIARFASVDALRGLSVAAMLLVNNPGDWNHVYAPLRHASWHGCTPADLIFPFFLFIVGVSIALGLVPRVENGGDRAALRRAVCWRGARIVGMGLLLHALAFWLLDREWFRPWGVLQRIGLCFAAVGLLAIYTSARTQWTLLAGLLLGYAALLAWGGDAPWQNLVSRLDTALFGALLYQVDPATGLGHDPEGLLSTAPAIASTLLGLRAGEWLRRGRRRALLLGGLSTLLLGGVWAQWLPLNKNLWTSSYVLWTGGWAMLALLLAHALVDRCGWPALGRAFGVNAIAAYAGSAALVYVGAGLGGWEPLYRYGFAGWMTPRFGPFVPSLAFALAFTGFWWGAVRWMYRRGWHLKL